MDFKDLLPLFCSNAYYADPTRIKPVAVVGALHCLDNDALVEALTPQYDNRAFGSDCNGGYAYFGSTMDLDKHWLNVLDYIDAVSKTSTKTSEAPPYAARWSVPKKGDMIVLYEDYDRQNLMPTPSTPHVLGMLFGAWTNDDTLDMVVCDKYYEKEWSVGTTPFDAKNVQHKALRRLARKVVKVLVPETD
jgi:hypothetical protein